jgi:hypothetical protein
MFMKPMKPNTNRTIETIEKIDDECGESTWVVRCNECGTEGLACGHCLQAGHLMVCAGCVLQKLDAIVREQLDAVLAFVVRVSRDAAVDPRQVLELALTPIEARKRKRSRRSKKKTIDHVAEFNKQATKILAAQRKAA